MKLQINCLLLTASASLASAHRAPSFAAVSWADPRIDLFGPGPDGSSIWHKFWTGWDWQPADGFERLPAAEASSPSVTSWAEGRFDIVYVNASGANVLHKYFGGGSWGPSWEDVHDLGGDVEALTSASWGDNRLDIVGLSGGSYVHKAWTGTEWFPAGSSWEDFGGNFLSSPGVGSWGPGRLDIVGISADNGSILHRYWQESWSDWESLEGGPFVDSPIVTSWGPGRFDIWAIDIDGILNHKFWDGTQYQGWERLGGPFSKTPKVVHWNESKIDIVGKNHRDTFVLKSFDGDKWHPDVEGFYDLSGPYDSDPVLLARRQSNFLSLFGVLKNALRQQIWSGFDWQPGPKETWVVGNLSSPYPDSAWDTPEDQIVMEL